MVEFTKSIKFIVAFLVVVIFISMFTNQKFTYHFLLIVLFSMLVLNSEKVQTMLGGLKYE